MSEKVAEIKITLDKGTVENWVGFDITDEVFDKIVEEIDIGTMNTINKGISWEVINIALREVGIVT